MQEAGKSVSDFAARKTKQSMSDVASSMGQIGGGFAVAAGAGFAAFSVSAVKAAAEAEQTRDCLFCIVRVSGKGQPSPCRIEAIRR